ncbi:MAG: hypothetical protein D6B27_06375 [Gammaproteobacteria bacterium]|nr:MAG: hypothetical protein D6B27_06375 [Gammaproteobacteria bacterium]
MSLQAIREKTSGWVLYAIVIMICVPFAIFGLGKYAGNKSESVIATVNGKEIKNTYFKNVYGVNKQKVNFESDEEKLADKKRILTEVVIKGQAVRGWIENNNFVVSSNLAMYSLKKSPYYTDKNGDFDPDLLDSRIKLADSTYAQFLAGEANRIKLTFPIQNGLNGSAFATEKEAEYLLKLVNQKRKYSYKKIRVSDFKDKAIVTEEEIKKYYENNSSDYLGEDKVKLTYIEISPETVASKLDVTDDKLLAHYKSNIARFTTEEKRKVSQIFIPVNKTQTIEKAKEKAAEVLQKLKDGESFVTLAKDYSADKKTADNGGDRGYVAKDDKRINKTLHKAVFSIEKIGQVSPITEVAGKGVYILKMTDLVAGVVKEYPVVKPIIKAELSNKAFRQYILSNKNEIMNDAADDESDNFAKVTELTGVKAKDTGVLIKSSGHGLFKFSDVKKAAFTEDVLLSGRNSELIEVNNGGKYYLVRIKEHKKPELKPFAEVKDSIAELLKNKKAKELTKLAAENIKKDIADNKLEILESGFKNVDFVVSRVRVPEPSAVVLDEVFTLPAPDKGKNSVGIVKVDSGDCYVVVLNGVKEFTAEEIKANKGQLVSKISQIIESNVDRYKYGFADSLYKSAEVEINEELLKKEK